MVFLQINSALLGLTWLYAEPTLTQHWIIVRIGWDADLVALPVYIYGVARNL